MHDEPNTPGGTPIDRLFRFRREFLGRTLGVGAGAALAGLTGSGREAEAQGAAIRAARAALAPRIAAARAAAALALGKREALDHLARRAEAEAKARLDAREEQERPPRQPG